MASLEPGRETGLRGGEKRRELKRRDETIRLLLLR